MVVVENWLPPTRDHWEFVVTLFTFFPVVTLLQWSISWYGAGKTSATSRLNIPGKVAWLTMEVPGFMTVLYVMNTITVDGFFGLPWENQVMGGIFTIHYLYRAILYPLLAPSMSPIHPIVWICAVIFQLLNGLSIGGYLGGYGPTTRADWLVHGKNFKVGGRMEFGLMVWALGFIGNMWHDEELREIRRASARNQQQRAVEADAKGKSKVSVDKVYMVPQNGFFNYVLYPHYFFEWIEWAGFWCMGGLSCVPARNFLFAEISTMLPRAVAGKKWYIERFGKERIGNRRAIIPGII